MKILFAALALQLSLLPQLTSDPDVFLLPEDARIVPQSYLLKKIQILGSTQEHAVRLSMHLKAGDSFTREDLNADIQRILQLGIFQDVKPEIIPLEQGVELQLQLKEFPVVQEIIVRQAQGGQQSQARNPDEAAAFFAPLIGQQLNLNSLQDLRAAFLAPYLERGEILARLNLVELRPSGELLLEFLPGVVEQIQWQGLERTQSYVLLREMQTQVGQVFNQRHFEADLERLRAMPLLKDVQLNKIQAQAQGVVLALQAEEAQQRDIGLDGSFNNRDGFLGGVYFKDLNFLGQGKNLNLSVQSSLDFQRLFSGEIRTQALYGLLSYQDPWFANIRMGFESQIFAYREPFINFEPGVILDRRGAAVNWKLPFSTLGPLEAAQGWSLSWGLRAENTRIANFRGSALREQSHARRQSATDVWFSSPLALNYQSPQLTSPWQQQFKLLLSPNWGDSQILQSELQYASSWLLWELPYWNSSTQSVLALNLRGGSVAGDSLPYQHFVSRLQAALRGFPEDGSLLGPHYLLGSLEWRQKIWGPVGLVAFVDYGDYFQTRFQGKWGTGLGLRVNSPLGLIRVDYALGFPSQPSMHNPAQMTGQWHFGLGQKF